MNEKLKVYAVVLKYPIGSLILISILNFCLLFIIIKLSNNLDTLKVLFINIIDLVGFSINFHHLFICASSFFYFDNRLLKQFKYYRSNDVILNIVY